MGACFQLSLRDEFLFPDRIPALKMVCQTRIRPLIYPLLRVGSCDFVDHSFWSVERTIHEITLTNTNQKPREIEF
jgi:hypothetical protein